MMNKKIINNQKFEIVNNYTCMTITIVVIL